MLTSGVSYEDRVVHLLAIRCFGCLCEDNV